MSAQENQDKARRFFAEQDLRKGPLPPELCAPNYTARIGSNPPMDREGHSQFAMMFYAALPDMYHTIDETFADTAGTRVAVRFTLIGTHKGNLLGVPPTGKQVRTTANILLHFEEGKVSELYGEFDLAGLLMQVGAIPVPA